MSENDVLPEREWAEGNRNHGASGGINEGGGRSVLCAPPRPGRHAERHHRNADRLFR